MSDETASSPEIAPLTDDASAPRPRRVSTPRPKKAAKKAAIAVIKKNSLNTALPEVTPPQQDADFEAPLQVGNDWAEPEGESAGGQQSQPDGPKRKRRRRKGTDHKIVACKTRRTFTHSPQRSRQNPRSFPRISASGLLRSLINRSGQR